MSATATETAYDLETFPASDNSNQQINNDAEHEGSGVDIEQSLPPCDGGAAAWKLLMTAFVFEALLWGKTCSPHERALHLS